jgi:hypothetical protein
MIKILSTLFVLQQLGSIGSTVVTMATGRWRSSPSPVRAPAPAVPRGSRRASGLLG